MSDIAIEKSQAIHVPVLVELMAEFYAESSHPLDRKWAGESFTRLMGDAARGAAWLARRGSENLGYVVLTLKHSMEFGGVDGRIDDFFVRPHFRRQGVGTALLWTLFQECRTRDVLAVHVEVGHDNKGANTLYEQFGLKDNGRRQLTAVTKNP